MKVSLTSGHVEAISALARRAYPEECCGLLVGTRGEAGWWIEGVIPVANVWEGSRADRYMLDPRALLRAERQARVSGGQVIGFFHSHPNGEAAPSQFDAELAWPDHPYLILPIDKDSAGASRCWVMPAEGQPFVEQMLEIRSEQSE